MKSVLDIVEYIHPNFVEVSWFNNNCIGRCSPDDIADSSWEHVLVTY